LIFCGTASAANYTVGPNSTYNYTSINQAVAVAQDGDNITVYPNNGNSYVENVNIVRNISLYAKGNVTVRPTTPSNVVFMISSGGSGTTIQGFTITGATTSTGIYLYEVNNCKILKNNIINCNAGINGYKSNNTQILENNISNTGTGYAYGIYMDGQSNKISGNKIYLMGTGSGDSRGIHIWGHSYEISRNNVNVTSKGTGWSYGIILNSNNNTGHNSTISGNIISSVSNVGTSEAINFGNAFSNKAYGNSILNGRISNQGQNNHLNYNRIVGNSIISSLETLDAQYNWFGSNGGPGWGVINGNVTCNLWLMMNIATPSSVNTGQTIKILVDFTHDSNGGIVNSSLINFPGTVSFKSTLGTISSTAPVLNGAAQATFYSGKTLGKTNITAKMDDNTLNGTIKVVDTIAPKVTLTYPKNKATNISRTKTIYLKFSENIKTSTNWSKIYIKNLKTGKKVLMTKYISGSTLSLKMKSKRYSYTWYQVYVPAAAVKDAYGNKLVKYYTFKFKTGK
jgi:parallel beta-helix repeat protein